MKQNTLCSCLCTCCRRDAQKKEKRENSTTPPPKRTHLKKITPQTRRGSGGLGSGIRFSEKIVRPTGGTKRVDLPSLGCGSRHRASCEHYPKTHWHLRETISAIFSTCAHPRGRYVLRSLGKMPHRVSKLSHPQPLSSAYAVHHRATRWENQHRLTYTLNGPQ